MVEAYWEEFNLGQQDLQSLLQGHKTIKCSRNWINKIWKW